MEPRVEETIVGQVVFLTADRAYRECIFENCTIVIDGSDFNAHDCSFINPEWQFVGNAATTLAILKSIIGALDGDVMLAYLLGAITDNDAIVHRALGHLKRPG
jgi:hypothetical protein